MRDQVSFKPKLLVAAIGLALSSQAIGQIIVTSNADSGAGSLREAIATANQNAGPDEIKFSPGLGPILLETELLVEDSVTITGPVAGQVLDGQVQTRIFRFTAPNESLTLKRLILQNGRTFFTDSNDGACTNVSFLDGRGGAICALGDLTLDEVVVRNNEARAPGGGIFASGRTEIRSSILSGNSVSGLDEGGAIEQQSGSLLLVNSVVTQNQSSDKGGGIRAYGADVTLVDSTLSFNTASNGGGLWVFDSFVTITNSTLTGNESTTRPGGAISARFSEVLLSNSTVTQNSGPPGETKGIFFYDSGEARLTVRNSILSGNGFGATGLNAGFFQNANGSLFIDAESSVFGDPIDELARNQNNVLTNAPGVGGVGQFGCGLVAGIGAYKQCVPLHSLLESSPAVDAGAELGNLAFDQRGSGFERTFGAARDIGAYEIQPAPALIVSNTNDSGPGSLRAMVDRANVTPGGEEQIRFEQNLGEITLTTGQIEISDSVRITAPASGQSISGGDQWRIFGVTSQATSLELENLRLRDGRATFSAIIPGNEGILTRCSEGLPYGGALCALGDVTIARSSISNSSTSGEGGAGGGMFVQGSLEITDSLIADNSTSGAGAAGGGISAGNSPVGENSPVNISNSWIVDNRTTGDNAGGAGLAVLGPLTLQQSTVSGNITTGDGSNGGGLDLRGNSSLINSTISRNQTTGGAAGDESNGGGIYTRAKQVSIRNSTITSNTSTSGIDGLAMEREDNGALYQLTLESVILSGNGNDNFEAGPDRSANTGILVVANASLLGDNDFPVGNPVNIFTNSPQLGLLDINGCFTVAGSPLAGDTWCVTTHLPLPNSDAIDNGSNPAPALSFDQRGDGFARTKGALTDIGAVETDPDDPDPDPGPELIFEDSFEN